MTPSASEPQREKQVPTLGRQLARASEAIPLILLICSGIWGNQLKALSVLIWGATMLLLLLLGLAFGVAALLRMQKDGRDGIFTQALVGLFLNGLGLIWMMWPFLAGYI